MIQSCLKWIWSVLPCPEPVESMISRYLDFGICRLFFFYWFSEYFMFFSDEPLMHESRSWRDGWSQIIIFVWKNVFYTPNVSRSRKGTTNVTGNGWIQDIWISINLGIFTTSVWISVDELQISTQGSTECYFARVSVRKFSMSLQS